MDERKTPAAATPGQQPVQSEGRAMLEQAFARGSDTEVPAVVPERTEHSVATAMVLEGLPPAKAERIAAMRRELAELQRQLTDAQQRIAIELHGRAEDAERLEAIEARLHEQEARAQESVARTAEAVAEAVSLRAKLASATTAADELRRELASRDAQLDEVRQQHRTATEPLERELEDQRKQHREATSQLETQVASLKDSAALVATRDAELATITTERDTARSDLAATRTRFRELATQLVELIGDGAGDAPALARAIERPKPPPMPPPRVTASRPVETILEVTEDPKSKLTSGLTLLGGVVLGCLATLAIVSWRSSGGDERDDRRAAPSSAAVMSTEPAPERAAPPAVVPEAAATVSSTSSAVPSPVAEKPAPPAAPAPPPTEVPTDGVIVLPPEAADHRVFVDGHVVSVKSSRAVVPCGSHEIRIGSHGTPRTLDIACGGETTVPEDMHDR
ncbi:MAG TPA: hypothetical protein VMJ10_20540 [Kofleriaceae bacterium]|nr:hypothetical protein [Kofleriaceae bacterium]